ncbi:hypothetical protein Tco_0629611 [Tanacetum coccineum]|uniref:Integrase, catalytic region, zinc finger, CCHC-type, peptidase aspartic, catalytic n=1 Tax=Tanacetum coccineum TaxID=301880 RepID=A0ABQ4WTL8_9ASTR
MFEKAKDLEVINKNISHKPIDYEKLNRLTKDIRNRFTPQQELSAEQAFWLHMSDTTNKPSDALPVKIEAPKELPKISLVNESLKKLKFHLAKFDNVVKIRTTPNACTKDLLNEIMEVKTVFDQMNAVVQQSSVDKQYLEIAKKELLLENDRLLQQIMSQDVLLSVMNSMSLIGETMNMDGNRKESCNLEAELLKSQNAFNDLLKLEQTKAEHPLDKELDFSCKHAQRIQELLVYVRDTCPNAFNLSLKKVVVTPKNKDKKVRFAKPLTSSSNNKQVESSKTSDSNTHVLSSTGLKSSTSKCGSKPTGNKRNDRIPQTPSRNMKNKVEAQPRKVNKKNRVVKPICDDNVKHSKLNENSDLNCATCKKSLFDDVHDKCLLDIVKTMNSRAKSAMKNKKQNI